MRRFLGSIVAGLSSMGGGLAYMGRGMSSLASGESTPPRLDRSIEEAWRRDWERIGFPPRSNLRWPRRGPRGDS